MRKVVFTLVLSIFFSLCAFSNPLSSCIKTFPENAETVYLTSFGAIKENKFEISEVQSDSGYILFKAQKKEYLLNVSPKGNGSQVKILPSDSDLSGGLEVQEAVFKAIEAALSKKAVK